MKGNHLEGLEGTNPLGFLAGLGVQVAFENDDRHPRLWWSDDITPHAVVEKEFTVEQIADQALSTLGRWKESLAVNPRQPNGTPMRKGDELKLQPSDIRTYLSQAVQGDCASGLATALVAEGSLDKQGVAKPSDLYFTAGQMKFLDMTRKVLGNVRREDLEAGLSGPWPYESTLPSLGWDVVDDRVYALRANNPSPEKKLTNPGPEALAVLGMSVYPVFAGRERTLTQGFSGSWKAGRFSWPLWQTPATRYGVRSLLAHGSDDSAASQRRDWYRSWGIFAVLRSPVRRSDQGGYGTFGPSEVAWSSTSA